MTRKNAPREREGLFAMVKLFEMVSWPENAILVLILRSAHVQQVPQARTCVARVSKDEDGDGVGALMLRDASQRSEAAEAAVLASRCDAPLHEGGRRPGDGSRVFARSAGHACAYCCDVTESSQDDRMQHVCISAARLGSIVAAGAKPY